MKRMGVVVILALAFCGLADSMYLAQNEISHRPLLCNIQYLDGCNTVANSPYSHLFGMPLAEYGVLFYGILFVLAALELVLFDQLLRRVLQGIALIGVLSSLYFTSIQIYFISSFCTYCAISAAITLLVGILASFIEPIRMRARQHPSAPMPPSPSLPMPPSV
ncbi:MAG: vitamin K epoxide reductase family protein [Minisyncoccota bacterium]